MTGSAQETPGSAATASRTSSARVRLRRLRPVQRGVYLVDLSQRITVDALRARVKANLTAEQALRAYKRQPIIEKRFSQDIKDQVRRQLISESYEQAVEKKEEHLNIFIIGNERTGLWKFYTKRGRIQDQINYSETD